MTTIWKLTLDLGVNDLRLPKYASILSAQLQHGAVRMWVIVEPERELETRRVSVTGTGHELRDKQSLRTFIATVQHNGFVWHVFDEGPVIRER